jgi:hypothetical protein
MPFELTMSIFTAAFGLLAAVVLGGLVLLFTELRRLESELRRELGGQREAQSRELGAQREAQSREFREQREAQRREFAEQRAEVSRQVMALASILAALRPGSAPGPAE